MKIKTLFLYATWASLLAASSNAQISIVDFTANGSANGTLRAKTTDTTSGDSWAFSDVTALFESTGGQNDRVFGGAASTWVTTSYNPTFVIGGGVTPRRLTFQIHSDNSTGPTTPASLTGVYVWNKADFLNGASNSTVTLGSNSTLSANLFGVGGVSRDVRFIVNQGGTYYVNDSGSALTTNTPGTYSIIPNSVTWSTINTSNYSIAGSFASVNFHDIRGVGLYFNFTTNLASTQIFWSVDDFQVTATPVPESSAFAALAGLSSLGFIVSRRNHRKSR